MDKELETLKKDTLKFLEKKYNLDPGAITLIEGMIATAWTAGQAKGIHMSTELLDTFTNNEKKN